MPPAINIQDPAGKTVGRRGAASDALSLQGQTKEDMRAWRKAFLTPFVPRGVYRFKTHEDADARMWKMIARQMATETAS